MTTPSFSQFGKAGYGLMNFTWVKSRKFSPTQFNSVLKKVIDESGASTKHPLFLNGGEFYGIPDRYEGLKLLGSFFESHPDYADKVYLSIKGGVDAHWGPDTSSENLTKTLDVTNQYLQPLYKARKELPAKLDMFTLCRIGKDPIEDVMKFLGSKQQEGQFDALCISEASNETLNRAIKVGKVAAIEVEFSLFHREAETNGLFKTCAEHDIAVVAYSPLGKGLLAGQKPEDLSKDDMRRNFDKWNDPEVMKNNQALVDKVHKLAQANNMTPAQFAISWITTLSGTTRGSTHYPLLLPIPGSTNADRQLNNLDTIHLKEDVLSDLDEFFSSFKTAGHRYNKQLDAHTYQ